MKTLFFLTILLISFNLKTSKQDENHLSSIQKILNSAIEIENKIGDVFVSKGSGTLISLNKQNYVLTNSHVCLSTTLDSAILGKPEKKNFKYTITSRNQEYEIHAGIDELEYKISEDWCLIPLNSKISYSIIDESYLEWNFSGRVKYITFNGRMAYSKDDNKIIQNTRRKIDPKSPRKEQFVFSGCSFSKSMINQGCDYVEHKYLIFKGKLQYTSKTDKENSAKYITLNLGVVYHLPTISGDSGSPVFNDNDKLVGLITASRTASFQSVEGINYTDVPFGIISDIYSLKEQVIGQ